MNLAIIGAGIAGLTAANTLKDDCQVTVFEKSRGVSGRSSTRYAGENRFDHGAQYFTAHSAEFSGFLAPLQARSEVLPWSPRRISVDGASCIASHLPTPENWLVAAPGMNSLAKALAQDIDIHLKTQITALEKKRQGWFLTAPDAPVFGPFDAVVLAIPAAQAKALIPEDHRFQPELAKVKQTGCYTLMLGTENELDLGFDVAEISHSPLGWLAVNSSKPQRPQGFTSLVVQSTNLWAEQHIDENVAEMQGVLLQELERLLGIKSDPFSHITTHRWRYADTATPLGQSHLYDPDLSLGICGDWCLKGRIEAAFTSGLILAKTLQNQ